MLLTALTQLRRGDASVRLPLHWFGLHGKVAEIFNDLVEQNATPAEKLARLRQVVGKEGKLKLRAVLTEKRGFWRASIKSIHALIDDLVHPTRAIAEVATAVTQGDLTRSITVEAQGEVAALKDTINEMIRNLKDTTQKNTEQDWLKTNLAKFSRMLQGQKDLLTVGQLILSELAPVVGAHQAEFNVLTQVGSTQKLKLFARSASARASSASARSMRRRSC